MKLNIFIFVICNIFLIFVMYVVLRLFKRNKNLIHFLFDLEDHSKQVYKLQIKHFLRHIIKIIMAIKISMALIALINTAQKQ